MRGVNFFVPKGYSYPAPAMQLEDWSRLGADAAAGFEEFLGKLGMAPQRRHNLPVDLPRLVSPAMSRFERNWQLTNAHFGDLFLKGFHGVRGVTLWFHETQKVMEELELSVGPLEAENTAQWFFDFQMMQFRQDASCYFLAHWRKQMLVPLLTFNKDAEELELNCAAPVYAVHKEL